MVDIDKTFCYNFRQKGVKLNSSHFSCASVSSLPPKAAQHTTQDAVQKNLLCAVKMLRGKEQ